MTIDAYRQMMSDCIEWVGSCEHEHELRLAEAEARFLVARISLARKRLAETLSTMPREEGAYPEPQMVRDPSWGSTHPVPPEYDDDADDEPWYEGDRPGPRPPHVQDGLPSDGRPRPHEPYDSPVAEDEGWGPVPPTSPDYGDGEDDPH